MLAIVIPTYNSLPTLKKLIKQVFKYTEGDFKVYVIEDGQQSKTIKWLKTQDKVHSIFHPNNRGVGPSWNDGLVEGLTDGCNYFAILNDDIELCPNWWGKCKEVFEDNIGMVCLDAPSPIPITGWFFVLSRECINKIGLFDEQFAPFTSEDADYWYRFQACGLKMKKVNLPIIHHDGGSTTLKKIDQERFKEVWNENFSKLRKKYPDIRMPDSYI